MRVQFINRNATKNRQHAYDSWLFPSIRLKHDGRGASLLLIKQPHNILIKNYRELMLNKVYHPDSKFKRVQLQHRINFIQHGKLWCIQSNHQTTCVSREIYLQNKHQLPPFTFISFMFTLCCTSFLKSPWKRLLLQVHIFSGYY